MALRVRAALARAGQRADCWLFHPPQSRTRNIRELARFALFREIPGIGTTNIRR